MYKVERVLAVLFFAVHTAVNPLFCVCQNEYMIKLLLNGGNATGIFAVKNIGNSGGKSKVFLFNDIAAPDNVYGNIVINETEYVKVNLFY